MVLPAKSVDRSVAKAMKSRAILSTSQGCAETQANHGRAAPSAPGRVPGQVGEWEELGRVSSREELYRLWEERVERCHSGLQPNF